MTKFNIIEGISKNRSQFEDLGLEPGSFYHHWEWWKTLSDSFGWPVHLLTVSESEKTIDYLPFVSKRTLLKKKNLALPLSHNLGFNSGRSRYEMSFPAGNWEIHQKVENEALRNQPLYKIAIADIGKFEDEEALFRSFSKSSIQRKIKKSEKENVVVREEGKSAEAWKHFYDMQLETRVRQKSLMYPIGFFKSLLKNFQSTDLIKLYITYVNEQPAAGIVFFEYRDLAIYSYGASFSNDVNFKLGVNQAAMWAAMRSAFAKNIKYVDFGITPLYNDNLLHYKQKWGAEATEFPYSFSGNAELTSREGKLTTKVLDVVCSLPKPIYGRISPELLKIGL